MTYYFNTILETPFDAAVQRTIEALHKAGFGIITEINVGETLKEKLGINFRPYRILGACNPQLAYEALQAEDKIGTMLPCNVIVQELAAGRVEIAAVDPIASMQAIDNPSLADIAGKVREKLREVVAAI